MKALERLLRWLEDLLRVWLNARHSGRMAEQLGRLMEQHERLAREMAASSPWDVNRKTAQA